MHTRILLIGAQGQLGRALSEILPADALRWGRSELDLMRQDEVYDTLLDVRPDIVINTAGITDVDRCEVQRDEALAVNALAPAAMARACKATGGVCVQISTDYVFGKDKGRVKPYVESDDTGTVNYYGETKFQGEKGVREADGQYLIVRVCGLYGGKRNKPSYVERVIEQARQGSAVRIRFDQVYSPTYVRELAPALWRLIQENMRGTIHLVNWGPVSRCEFTQAIVEMVDASVSIKVEEGDNQSFVPRPSFSALASERIVLEDYMIDWREALKNYIKSLP